MSNIFVAGAFALVLSLAACDGAREDTTAAPAQSDAAPANTVYSATGEVTAVSEQGVTISHGPVPELEWPPMTMAFNAESPDMPMNVAVGDQVSFSFRQSNGASVLTSIAKK